MKRYAAYDPPEYVAFKPDPEVMAEYRETLRLKDDVRIVNRRDRRHWHAPRVSFRAASSGQMCCDASRPQPTT